MLKAKIALSLCVCILLVACADQAVQEPEPSPSTEGTTLIEVGPTEALPDCTAIAPPDPKYVMPDSTATTLPSPTAAQMRVFTVEETEAYRQLPEIVVSIDSILLASPNHPTAYLPSEPIPIGGRVRLLGSDKDGAWLLVLHGNMLGWMPSMYSGTGIGTAKPSVIVESLSGKCTRYLGGMITPDEAWVSSASGSVVVQGLIYRPKPETQNEEASLAIEIEGYGEVVTPETTLAPLAGSDEVYFFTFVIENLQAQSRIRLRLIGMDHEPMAFQAAFFSNSCSDTLAAAEPEILPSIGETTTTGPIVTPTPVVIQIVLGPRPPTGAVPTDDVKAAVLDVLSRFEAIRIRSHGPSHDVTGMETVLAEKRLSEQLNAVNWQRDNNAYYVISVHQSHVMEVTALGSTRVDVLVDKVESREFYINGKLGSENTVYDDHYQVRYSFKRIDGEWYIVDREVILPTAMTTPTPVPIKEPTPKCGLAVDSQLSSAWTRDRLGCPTAASSVVWAAWEPFERGRMLWRSDTMEVYVLHFENGTVQNTGDWKLIHDEWDGSNPNGVGLSPPAGLREPIRGFGWVWRTHLGGANSRIGWARQEERGICIKVQPFERGFIFRSSQAQCSHEYNRASELPLLLFALQGGEQGKWWRYGE